MDSDRDRTNSNKLGGFWHAINEWFHKAHRTLGGHAHIRWKRWVITVCMCVFASSVAFSILINYVTVWGWLTNEAPKIASTSDTEKRTESPVLLLEPRVNAKSDLESLNTETPGIETSNSKRETMEFLPERELSPPKALPKPKLQASQPDRKKKQAAQKAKKTRAPETKSVQSKKQQQYIISPTSGSPEKQELGVTKLLRDVFGIFLPLP